MARQESLLKTRSDFAGRDFSRLHRTQQRLDPVRAVAKDVQGSQPKPRSKTTPVGQNDGRRPGLTRSLERLQRRLLYPSWIRRRKQMPKQLEILNVARVSSQQPNS